MQKLNEMHQNLQNKSNYLLLQKIKEGYVRKQLEANAISDSMINNQFNKSDDDTGKQQKPSVLRKKLQTLSDDIAVYEKLMNEYEFIASANTPVLLIVESARPSLSADRPKILQTLMLIVFAVSIFCVLLALFLETRIK
jgi:hypothetical protein